MGSCSSQHLLSTTRELDLTILSELGTSNDGPRSRNKNNIDNYLSVSIHDADSISLLNLEASHKQQNSKDCRVAAKAALFTAHAFTLTALTNHHSPAWNACSRHALDIEI
jgi:hypothetical protein